MCCPKLEKNINQSSLLTPLCQPLQYNTSKAIDETVKILFFKYFLLRVTYLFIFFSLAPTIEQDL